MMLIRIEEDLIDQLLPRIRKMFESLGISAQFVAKSSAEELESATRHAISQNQRLLLAMRGDGTF